MQNFKIVFLLLLIQVLAAGYSKAQHGLSIDLAKLELKKPNSSVKVLGQKVGSQTLNITLYAKDKKVVRIKAVDAQTKRVLKIKPSGDGFCENVYCYTFQAKHCWTTPQGVCLCVCGYFKIPNLGPSNN